MQIPFVDLKRQYQGLREEVLGEITKAIDSMQLLLGPNVRAFEDEFSRHCGTEFAVGVGSGTEALHLALVACGVKRGDEVITVANTYFATIEALALIGAKPVFVEIDPLTFNIDPSQIESRITSKTKAILPIHLYGQPADMDPIVELARAYNLKIVEDACQAHGAEYRGRRTGSLGDAGCFSFYLSKNLGAYGEGGMIVTSDPEVSQKCKMLRDHGQDVKYHHRFMGVNGRLDEIQAAVLRVKLRHLDEWNEKRRRVAEAYEKGLPSTLVKPIEMSVAKHVYHLYVIRTSAREQLAAYLEAKGVATGMHYPIPIHLQEAYRGYCSDSVHLPITEKAASEILSLPMFPELTVEEINYVCGRVRDFVESEEQIQSRAQVGAGGG